MPASHVKISRSRSAPPGRLPFKRTFLHLFLTAGVGLVFLAVTKLSAQTTTWTGAEDNNWLNAANWTDGIPDTSTIAAFTTGNADNLSITFNAGVQAQQLLFTADAPGPVFFDLPQAGSLFVILLNQGGTVLEVEAGSPAVTMDLNRNRIRLSAVANTIRNNSANPLTILGTGNSLGLFDRQNTLSGVIVDGSGDIIMEAPRFAGNPAHIRGLTLASTFTGILTLNLDYNASASTEPGNPITVNNGTLIMNGPSPREA